VLLESYGTFILVKIVKSANGSLGLNPLSDSHVLLASTAAKASSAPSTGKRKIRGPIGIAIAPLLEPKATSALEVEVCHAHRAVLPVV
jgi:hypothetical protein